jgi:ADP-ribosylglycohydrolase
MRTSILGCYQYNDIDKVIANTEAIAKVTHYDPRCLASCVAVDVAIALILQGHTKYEDIMDKVLQYTKHYNQNNAAHQQEYMYHLNANLEQLKLDEEKAIGYTLKCLGSGFYGLRSEKSFKATLNDLIREGGDADTNGAVCGALYGVRVGYRGLPHDWLRHLPHKKWLDQKIVQFLTVAKII